MRFTTFIATALCAVTILGKPIKLSKKPGLGETGVFYDDVAKITKVHFGDDVETHAAHIQFHESKYPGNLGRIFKSADGTRKDKSSEYGKNAYAALHDVAKVPGFVRDEKPWASLSHGAKMTSVVKVPKAESQIESALARVGKDVHADNPLSQGIQLIDNRTVKKALDPALILKTMRRRGRGLGDVFDDAKDKAEGALDDLKNDWDKLQAKLEDLIKPVTDELDGVGSEITLAVKQAIFPGEHQLGVFWQGLNAFESQWNLTAQQNSSAVCNETLARDQAALEVYSGGFENATKAIPKELSDLIVSLSGYSLD